MNQKLRFLIISLIAGLLLFLFFPVIRVKAQSSYYEVSMVDSKWIATAGGSNVSGLNTSEVRWGERTITDWVGGYPVWGEQSGFRFEGLTNQKFVAGEIFLLGKFTHMNHPASFGSAAGGAELQLTLDFTDPSISPDPFIFDFEIEETSNGVDVDECSDFQITGTSCDDKITFPESYGQETFQIGNKTYTLEIMGFVDSYTPGDPLGTPVPAFITEEKKENVAYLVGRLASMQPDIQIVKTTNGIDVASENDRPYLLVDDPVTWEYKVTNIGNVDLTGIAVEDYENNQSIGPITCEDETGVSITSLTAGAFMTCTASGTVQAGPYNNTATVTAHYSDNSGSAGQVEASDSSWYFGVNPGITLTKTANPVTFTDVNDVITYTFVAENTGNVTLTDVKIDDTGLTDLYDWSCDQTGTVDLGPTGELTCTAKYKIKQADIDAGQVLNTATASGQPPSGARVEDDDSATVTGPQMAPGIILSKTASPTTYAAVGDVITYTLVATNTGNVTLTDVTVSDPLLSNITCGSDGTLEPNGSTDSLTCTATYTITQADIDAGQVLNTATASGQPPSGARVEDDDSETVTGPQMAPGITLTKTASPTTYAAVGDVITYTLVATNIGNVTLTDVTISDPLLSNITCGSDTTLEPDDTNDSLTCTATYTITQADIDAGQVLNTATASGQPPSGARVEDDDSATVTGQQMDPDIMLTKTATPVTFTAVGDVITYTLVATNTGNVTLTDVTVTDSLLNNLSCGTDTTLEPDDTGDSLTCTATYTITQADLDVGQFMNTATASGQPPSGARVEDDDSVEVKKAAISLTKTADVPTYKAVGDVITYTFVVTNTGNVELTNVSITDVMSGLSSLNCGPSITLPTTLSLGASLTCTATYNVTPADLAAEKIENTAYVTAKDPADNEISSEDSEIVDKIAVSLTKTSDPEVFTQVGEVITYTFVVKNTGNLTLYNIAISDPLSGLSELNCGPAGSLAFLGPNSTVTCTATYQIKQIDIDRGFVENIATATGKDESGQTVQDDDDALVEGPKQGASIALEKTADPEIYVAVGDSITYTFTATNNGLFSLSNVTIEDPLPGLTAMSCTETLPTSLQPGDSVTCEAGYTITQDDIDNGVVENTAVATGTGSNEEVVEDDDGAVVEGPKQAASIHLAKSTEPATYNAVGDEIVYSFVVTNNGIYTLYGVTVTDPLFSLNFGPIESLEPGESKTYKYTYTITQADLDAKSIHNVATAMGYDPDENPVSSTDEAIVERPEPKKVESLPTTGFAPNQITSLPPQSIDKSYTAYSDFWLEIPSLGVRVDVLGVPKSNYGWDVTWLNDTAGWLEGTTFPTWPGNAVVTAHVWDAFDKAGPFVDLNKLQWGDEVVVHLNGSSYVFEVRSKHTVRPDDMSLVEREEEYAWLTLLTCRGFDEESNVYQYRLIVRAVLMDVDQH